MSKKVIDLLNNSNITVPEQKYICEFAGFSGGCQFSGFGIRKCQLVTMGNCQDISITDVKYTASSVVTNTNGQYSYSIYPTTNCTGTSNSQSGLFSLGDCTSPIAGVGAFNIYLKLLIEYSHRFTWLFIKRALVAIP